MDVPSQVRTLANAFALGALPLWWYLDPSRGLDAPLPGRDAWEARVQEVWDELAAGVEVRAPHDPSHPCNEVGVLADGTDFPPLGYLCDGLRSAVPALRQCGLSGADGFSFALLVRSDAAENRAVVRSGIPERDACAERALGSLPLADRAPPGGALLAAGSVDLVGLQPDGPLPSREAVDALIADEWDQAVAEVRDPDANPRGCQGRGWGGVHLCSLVDEAAPALRACGYAEGGSFRFVVLARGESEKMQTLALSGDPARDACTERVLDHLPIVQRPGAWEVAWGSEHIGGLEGTKWYQEDPGPKPPMFYASHLSRHERQGGKGDLGGWASSPTVGIVTDDALVGRVHDLVACPSDRVGTRLDASWREGTLTVASDPPVPCVEANVRARSSELLDAFAAAIDTTKPDFAERVAEAGPPRGWPTYRSDLWIVLPPVTP